MLLRWPIEAQPPLTRSTQANHPPITFHIATSQCRVRRRTRLWNRLPAIRFVTFASPQDAAYNGTCKLGLRRYTVRFARFLAAEARPAHSRGYEAASHGDRMAVKLRLKRLGRKN